MPITEDMTMIITLLVGLAAVLIPILLLLIWSSQRSGSQKLEEINRRLDNVAESLQQINFQQSVAPAPPVESQPQVEQTLDLVTEPAAFTAATAAAAMDEPSPAVERELSAEDFPEDDGESLDLDFPVDEDLAELPAEEPSDTLTSPEPEAQQEEPDSGLGDFEMGDDFAAEEAESEAQDVFGDAGEEADWSFEEEAPEKQEVPTGDNLDPFTAAATAGIEEADDFGDDFEFSDDQLADDLGEPDAGTDDFSFETPASDDLSAEEPPAEEPPAEEPPAEEPPAEEPPAEEPPAEEPPAEEPPAEEPQGIIPLPSNPDRPGVSMARCAACDHKLAYKETLSGKRARCPSCKSAFVLP